MRIAQAAVVAVFVSGCGDDADSKRAGTTTGGTPVTDDFVAGGDRPVTVEVPPGYDPTVPAPLLILLHGFTASGLLQEIYFQLGPIAEERGMFYAHPDGTVNADGSRFWNATDACCDFDGTGVDDSGYLAGLVDEIAATVNVDPSRVYFAGHSNGGYMSYRMACDHADRIAAIVTLAGAMWKDSSKCGASEPVSVLQVHGDQDASVAYEDTAEHPGALESVAYWAKLGGCGDTPVADSDLLDLDDGIAGADTRVERFEGCDAGLGMELWTIEGGSHIPELLPAFGTGAVDFLLAHPKP
jgi:polyhydroxybutyrate depolymerase